MPVQRDNTTTNSNSAEGLESEALNEVRSFERAMQARADQAFNKTDPIRIFSDGLVKGGAVFVSALGKVTQAAELRFSGLFDQAQASADAARSAAERQIQADVASLRKTLAEEIRQSNSAAVAADRRVRGARAYGIAGIALVATFGLGMMTERWRGTSGATLASATSLERLQEQANATTAQLSAGQTALAQSAQQILVASAAAAPALSLLTAMGQLPQAELEAAQAVIAELSSAASTKRQTSMVALREAMRLTPAQRRQAIEFASIEDEGMRKNVLEIGKLAAVRGDRGWFQGETPYKGCVANGPSIPTDRTIRLQTCLVVLPQDWPTMPDSGLRRYYLNNGG